MCGLRQATSSESQLPLLRSERLVGAYRGQGVDEADREVVPRLSEPGRPLPFPCGNGRPLPLPCGNEGSGF